MVVLCQNNWASIKEITKLCKLLTQKNAKKMAWRIKKKFTLNAFTFFVIIKLQIKINFVD